MIVPSTQVNDIAQHCVSTNRHLQHITAVVVSQDTLPARSVDIVMAAENDVAAAIRERSPVDVDEGPRWRIGPADADRVLGAWRREVGDVEPATCAMAVPKIVP